MICHGPNLFALVTSNLRLPLPNHQSQDNNHDFPCITSSVLDLALISVYCYYPSICRFHFQHYEPEKYIARQNAHQPSKKDYADFKYGASFKQISALQ
jgi:hypothetical protein